MNAISSHILYFLRKKLNQFFESLDYTIAISLESIPS